MTRLLLGTTNQNKAREIRAVLAGTPVEIVTLSDIAAIAEPDEPGVSFWENARHKALAYARASGLTAIAEDSGLVIDALGGEPGVRSARFLGADASYPDRFAEIHRRLAAESAAPRDATFVTALAVASPDGVLLFETEAWIDGRIADRARGAHGFGYDPIFFYPPLQKTTGEMTLQDKNAVSHRARAFRDLARWLRSCDAGTFDSPTPL